MKFDLIGWGALNVDRLCQVNEFAPSDGETFVNSESKTCGGSASNTTIGAARLGLKTGHIGKVGTDSNGAMMKKYLEDNNVNTDNLIVSEGESGEVIGFVNSEGDRKLYVTPKINDKISNHEINRDYIKNTKILHLTSFVGLNENDPSINTQIELLKELNGEVTISFDPGMLYVNRGQEFMDTLIEYTDILLTNESELLITTNKDNLQEAIDIISPKVDILVVKCSTNGSIIISGDEEYKIDIFKVDTVDTTGAGDAYNAGFLYGLIKEYPLDECGIIASYVAAKSTTKAGATEALPFIEEISIENIIRMVKK